MGPGDVGLWKQKSGEVRLIAKVGSLRVDPENARLHPVRNLGAIQMSLTDYGQQKPVVVTPDGTVKAGSGLLEAARALNWPTVWVAITSLEGTALAGYTIADNRTGELGTWDYKALALMFKAIREEGLDLNRLGWQDHELEPLLTADWDAPETGGGTRTRPEGEVRFRPGEWETAVKAADAYRDGKDMPVEEALVRIFGEVVTS